MKYRNIQNYILKFIYKARILFHSNIKYFIHEICQISVKFECGESTYLATYKLTQNKSLY